MNKRAYIVSVVVLLGFAVVLARLVGLMVFDHARLLQKAKQQYVTTKDLAATRGAIFDYRGRPLAINVDSYSIYANPKDILDARAVASEVSDALGLKKAKAADRLSSDKSFVWLKRKADLAEAERLKAQNLKGLGFLPETKRFYPKGELASHVIGFVGIDDQALEGVELKYDADLKGEGGNVVVRRDAGGRTLSVGEELQTRGNNIRLTIDEGLQYIVERSLSKAVRQWKAESAICVMMDPYSGEILAMANWPTYDPNAPSASSTGARRNRAITDPYEPGSTFKLITASAVIEQGVADVNTKIDTNPGYINVGDKRIYDIHNKGVLTFKEVIKLSSNVGTVMVSSKLENQTLHEYIRAFGFGDKTGIDLPGESAGYIRPLKEWSETTHAAMSIGYEVLATPLQLVRAYSAIANGGRLVVPHIVSEVTNADGDVLFLSRPDISAQAVSSETAAVLKDMLVTVTQEGGTAEAASVEGNLVAGKTGTSRLLDPDTGKYSTERYASSFAGFVPAKDPRVAMIVVVFEPKEKYYGGQVAAPVFRDIAEQSLAYLNVPREDIFKKNMLMVDARAVR